MPAARNRRKDGAGHGLSGPARAVVCILLAAASGLPLHGLGGKDSAVPPDPVKGEWVLAVTALDVSSLPPAKRSMGDALLKSLTASLVRIERRRRSDEETARYEADAWYAARTAAGKALAEKRAERDALLYRGHPEWKYRSELAKLDSAVTDLEEKLSRTIAEPVPVDRFPLFKITDENAKGIFPQAPVAGGERSFCLDRSADVLLLGSVEELYGRTVLSLRLYDAVARDVIHRDLLAFSPEDRDSAMDELAESLFAALSGTRPAYLTVSTDPDSAAVAVNGAYGGRGGAGPVRLPAGPVRVEAFAEGYGEWSGEAVLDEGERATLSLRMEPLARVALDLDASEDSAAVYRNGLYIGMEPLAVELDRGSRSYVTMENIFGASFSAVVPGEGGVIDMKLQAPDPEGYAPVESARRNFYGAYGRFWIALPAAFLLNGLARSYADAASYQGNPAIIEDAYRYYYLSLGASLLAGAFFAETIYRLSRYVYTSGDRSTPALEPKMKDGR